ncbi:MAG: hypothetical protein ACTSWP_00485 [Candidatus Freyarchaeota archaeon]|nr:hypothetical protein [Candidatus Freyrarchaeum guaymaensis]
MKSARSTETIPFRGVAVKYHYDGHRGDRQGHNGIDVCMHPREAMKHHNICPVCGKKLTIGVQHRVEELADREEGFTPKDFIPFKRLIPLAELIAVATGTDNLHARAVRLEYERLIKTFGNEYKVLLEAPQQELEKVTHQRIVQLILLNRDGKIKIKPGFDGVYGKIILEDTVKDEPEKLSWKTGQQSLDSYF